MSGNTGMDYLFPEFWATAFDEADLGLYNLPSLVSRKYESQISQKGDKVNVPLVPSFTAGDWTPGDAITAGDITQEEAEVELDESKSVPITLSGKTMTMSPYDLITTYGVPMAEAILAAVNTSIYKEALKSTYFINPGTPGTTAIDEDDVVDARTQLTKNKAGTNRKLVLAPDDYGVLLKADAFQYVEHSGDQNAMKDGKLVRRFGFDIYENNVIEDYTPDDLGGAVDNTGTAYAAGATTIECDAFDDDGNPIREGDLFTLADEVGTPVHTVTATETTTSDTTSLTFSPALAGGDPADNNDVITVIPSRSALAFVPSALALAARPYAVIPEGAGVKSKVINYQGIPIRISIWHDGKLGVNVQADILYGVKLVKTSRLVRILC